MRPLYHYKRTNKQTKMSSKVCNRCELKMWDSNPMAPQCRCEKHFQWKFCQKKCVCKETEFSVRLQQCFDEAGWTFRLPGRPYEDGSSYDRARTRCGVMTAYPRWKRYTFAGSSSQKGRNFSVCSEVRKWQNDNNPCYDSD